MQYTRKPFLIADSSGQRNKLTSGPSRSGGSACTSDRHREIIGMQLRDMDASLDSTNRSDKGEHEAVFDALEDLLL